MAEEVFSGQKYMLLTSFQKNGTGVPTPVWFVYSDNKFYFNTRSDRWKVKRIQNNPRVEICPCDYGGEIKGQCFEAQARIVEGSEAEKAEKLMKKKYGFMFRLVRFGSKLKGKKNSQFEVVPGPVKDSK